MEVLEKILVIQTAFLGDAVLTLPLIQKIKEKNPDSKIFVLCIPSTKNVFINSKFVSEIIVYDKRGKQKSFLSYIKLLYHIRSIKFTKVVSPHRSLRSTLISFFSGAITTVGYDTASMSFLYVKKVKYQKDKHEVERNISLLCDERDNDSWRILPELEIGEEVKLKIDRLLAELPFKKYIAFAPGSVWKTKVYPKEYFVELTKLISFNEYGILLIGGKEDSGICESIVHDGKNSFSFAGKLSITESVELLKRCTLLVSNDSAPTHLAMIADIPTLTIYCSTIPGFGFYPYNKTSIYISYDELKCKPCGIHGHNECPIKTFECAYNLSPEIVFNKLKEILPA